MKLFLLLLLMTDSVCAQKTKAQIDQEYRDWEQEKVTLAQGVSGGSVPSGMILFKQSGTCPTGWTELNFSGRYISLTVAAGGDVGNTGGSNSYTPGGSVSQPTLAMSSYTPAGTVSQPSLTMNSYTPAGTNGTTLFTPQGANGSVGFTPSGSLSWPAGVPTFAGSSSTVGAQAFTGTPFSSVINHTHTITSTLTVQGGTTAATTGTHVMNSTATGGSARVVTAGDAIASSSANPSGGVASITPAGTNSTSTVTPLGTVAWPAGVPTFAGGAGTVGAQTFTGTQGTVPAQAFAGSAATLTGTVSQPSLTGSAATLTGTVSQPSFSGTPATITPQFVKLIACQKN